MHGRTIQFSRCIHASIKTTLTQQPYCQLAPSLAYFVAHRILIHLNYSTLLYLQVQYKLCIEVAFVAFFEEVALLSTGNGLNFSSSRDFNRCCHIVSCFQRSVDGSYSLHNAVATASENTPHASQPCCSCIAMLLTVTIAF